MQLLDNLRTAYNRFITSTDALTAAVAANTTATEALLATSKQTLAASLRAEESVRYLALAERHKRESTGQRSDFGGGQ
jgi:hypothetical protein